MNFLVENLDILSKRFPFLYFLLISQINTKNRASDSYQEYSKIEIDNFDVLFIYKCQIKESAFEDLKIWLTKENKRLFFFDDDLNNLRFFFQTKLANDLLKYENISFHFFTKIPQLVEQITPDLKSKKIKIITFTNNSKKFEALKKEVMHQAIISYFANHDRIYSHKIFKNFYSNIDKLQNSFLINKFKNKFKDKPAIVLGAGPSLKYSFETLKRLQNNALFIAGGSAITCLSKMGILPHLGVIIDPNFEEYQRMKEAEAFEIPMIYSTRVNSGVFKTFNGPLGYIKSEICGFFEVWLDEELKITSKSLYKKKLEKALTVTTVSLMLAKFLGCNPIILDGIDLAYSQNQRYSVDIIKNNQINSSQTSNIETYLTKDKHNNEIYTNLNWEIEKDWIKTFAKDNKKIKFLNATKDGMKINNIEDISILEIEKNYLKTSFDFKSYIHFLSQENMISNAKEKDFDSMKISLKNSFKRCSEYLQDIINNNPEYKAILSKEELPEEIAYKYFLMEFDFTLSKFYKDSDNYSKLKVATDLFLKEFTI